MISQPHRCLFVHVPRAAGQAVERYFLGLAGLDWNSRDQLLLKPNDDPKLGPPRLAHLTASQYLEYGYLSPQQFAEFYKFTFVRNPWDRMVSFYKRYRMQSRFSFHDYVLKYFKKNHWITKQWVVRPQIEYLCDSDGKQLMDFVGRFESIQTDFETICSQLGLAATALPRTNESHAAIKPSLSPKKMIDYARYRLWGNRFAQHKAYQDYYDATLRDFVGELYLKDCDAFGYSLAIPQASEPKLSY